MHPHCRSRCLAVRLRLISAVCDLRGYLEYFPSLPFILIQSFYILINIIRFSTKAFIMNIETHKTLMTMFRQLRRSLRQPHPGYSLSRPLSQLAPFRHPAFPRLSQTPQRGVSRPSLPVRPLQTRQVSDSTCAPSSAVAHSTEYPSNAQIPTEELPKYELTFTCKPCMHRSTHRISKHGYHKGSILITCPKCSNRHVMSDHLKVGFQRSLWLSRN